MSSARSRANHSLYLAKILVQSWRAALTEENVPASALNQAFLPAARDHLLQSYGWFLLEVSGAEIPDSGRPPESCAELPGIPAGKAVSGEIREFQQLEAQGWLAEILAPAAAAPQTGRSVGNLAVTAGEGAGWEQVRHWLSSLESQFARMRDSLEEC